MFIGELGEWWSVQVMSVKPLAQDLAKAWVLPKRSLLETPPAKLEATE
jgi:hypothetical protein